jgi:ABC-type multidrug transport system fused ATPase/permease subunit
VNQHIIQFSRHYWRKHPYAGIAAVVLMVAATAIDTFGPIFVGRIVDALVSYGVGSAEGFRQALIALASLATLHVTYALVRWGAIAIWSWVAVRCLYEIVSEGMR